MPLNKHVETVQLTDTELSVVQDDSTEKVEVYHGEEADPLAVFGYGDSHGSTMTAREARIRGVEYANGYAHAEGGDD